MARDQSEGKAVTNVSQYMQSHGGQHPEGRAELFTRAGEVVALDRFVEASQADPRVWTIIVSPEHGNHLDMQAFARDFMRQVEQDTGRTLDWLGVVHSNTPHRHAHLLIRGRDRWGKVLNFPPAYVQRGMRHRAMAMQARMYQQGQTVKPDVPGRGQVRTQIEQLAARVTSMGATRTTKSESLSW